MQVPTLFVSAAQDVSDDFFGPVSGVEVANLKNDANKTLTIGLKAQAAGIRTASVTGTNADISASGATVDLTLISGTGTSDLTGGSGSDTMTGGAGANVFTTGAGDDSITGGASADTFNVTGTTAQTITITDLGVGADKIDIDNANAVVNATVSINGGIDLGNAAMVSGSTLNVTITDNVATANRFDIGAEASSGDMAGKVFIDASVNDNGNFIEGFGSTDTIKAGAGADTLDGGGGIDSITGGDGNDVFLIQATTEQVAGDIVDGGAGTNKFVVANAAATMAAEFDMDNIDDVLTIETSGTGATNGNTTLTFSSIAEVTEQIVVVDGTSLAIHSDGSTAGGDLIVTTTPLLPPPSSTLLVVLTTILLVVLPVQTHLRVVLVPTLLSVELETTPFLVEPVLTN